jgi:toxin ParE1/3/4
MAYKLSRAAAQDVIQIYETGVQDFGVEQAERYHAGLEKIFTFLAENPGIARKREELRQQPRVLRYKAHLVFYRLDGEDIFIQRVRHGREDWSTDWG